MASVGSRVFLPTGTGPDTTVTSVTGPVRFRFRPVTNRANSKIQISIRKNEKVPKNPKNTSSYHESNSVKNFQIFVRLVYFADIRSSTKKEKGKKFGRLNF